MRYDDHGRKDTQPWRRHGFRESRLQLANERADRGERDPVAHEKVKRAAFDEASRLCGDCMRPKLLEDRYWFTTDEIRPDTWCETCHGEGFVG